MQILIIGGSGRIGKLTIDECLRRGHTVTALVRKADSLPQQRGLTVVIGTPLKEEDVKNAFTASSTKPEVAIVTLASLRATDSPFSAQVSPPRMMADSTANLTAVMQQLGSPSSKIVVCSAAGVGETWSMLPFAVRAIISHTNTKYGYDDHNILEKELKASGMNFVLAKPMRLTDGELASVKFYDEKSYPGMAASTSRKSVAAFLVDAAEKKSWDGSGPVMSN